MQFATQETLKQPKGGLIIEERQEQDHILGATGLLAGPDFEVQCPSGQWSDVAPDPEIQRTRFGDTFMCVSYSLNNAHEFLIKKMFDEVLNKSDIFLGVGSGTRRGQGNSKRAVAEWNRLNGFVLESDYPLLQDMTIDEVYKPLTRELLAKGLKNLAQYSFFYKWLPDNGFNSLKDGLRYSPVQVDVLGSYKMNAKGYIIWDNANSVYSHEVLVFGYEDGECWYVYDSETNQFLKFAWEFPFGSPMIHAIKKNMKITIYKKKGQAGLAVKTSGEPSLIFFSGGSVTAETLFKSAYGVEKFSQLPIVEVDEWPYPPRHIMNTTPYRG